MPLGALSRFEAFVESLIEGPFARLARGVVQPVQMAKLVEREMEAKQTVGPGKLFVPNSFIVAISPADYEQLAPVVPALEREIVAYAVNLAHERGFSFLGAVRVKLVSDAALARHHLRVASEMLATPEAIADLPEPEVPPIERTQTLNLGRLDGAVLAEPSADLLFSDGGEERTYPIRDDVITIGRALDNDLVVEDPAVSRHHAEIRRQYGRFYLADLQSTNGTWVNGRRAEGCFLVDGDVVRVGSVELVLRLGRAGSK